MNGFLKNLKFYKKHFVVLNLFLICLSLNQNYLFAEKKVKNDKLPVKSSQMIDTENTDVVNIGGVEMVLVPEGKLPQFRISKYEVTQSLYNSVMRENPSYFIGESFPVEQVSWYKAIEFCNRLSVISGFEPYYTIDKANDDPDNKNSGIRWKVLINENSNGFRLPASEEWDYAAFVGTRDKNIRNESINKDYCWYAENSEGKTHPVGTKKPNPLGLHDMIGNVQEWCFDWHPSHKGAYRILRGGHYNFDKVEIKPENIDYRSPNFEFGFTGIRLLINRVQENK